jgi:hypothetical protein
LNALSRSAGAFAAGNAVNVLPALRFEISEACHILRMSRAQLYHRIGEGAIKIQKDGARTYITTGELERYVKFMRSACPTPAAKLGAGRFFFDFKALSPVVTAHGQTVSRWLEVPLATRGAA